MFHLLLLFGFCDLGICLLRQYHFINEHKTWAEAQRYCRENYIDLATVNNTEDALALINILDTWDSKHTWIGLYDDLSSWKWSLDDESFYKEGEKSFRNWYIMKPRNLNVENVCVHFVIRTAIWWAAPCSLTLPFICFDGRVNASERYVLVTQSMNWTEAQGYCREHYTDLITVPNDTENQKIGLLLSKYNNKYHEIFYSTVWIGLYRTRSWSDKSNSSFRNWKPGQPDHYGQNGSCTTVSFSDSGKWTDENCSQAFPFFCYRTNSSTSSPNSSTSSHQIHFVNENKTWTEAQRYCREIYTDLATIDNMEEMNTLLNTVNSSYSGSAWIGLYDDPDSWKWSLDDDTFYQEGEKDFRGWYQEPDNDNGKEMCVSMNSEGKWFDSSCTDRKPFVCYDGTKNSYVVIHYTMTWEEAQTFCRANHKDLASVRNEMELQHILSITKGLEVWIGLYRNRLWSDQSNFTFTNWRPAGTQMEANIERVFSTKLPRYQHCTAVSHYGTWTDENCFASLPFICYTTFAPVAVMGLQLKIKANGNAKYSEIEGWVLIKLGEELSRLGLSRDITLNVRNIRELGP